ncbi:NAD-dependent epimerase/dehydratase family protein [Streptomyces alanosinicus]|uniref:Nucleoside-diphosphate sugar epimerase n=1 Tax=Streptomyces alanosinicus TaxID=68171 RepID=A0A918YT44_9ACTN|nr:NAD(P)-dependent oxidoreductase [Streptomyces alanosinicus]GHE15605.1 nucleoside-diphosphate sugar epimerase [Streptomyces alanosinicus]
MILVTGGTGFIGTAVARQLDAGDGLPRIRLTQHVRPVVTGRADGAETVHADLTRPASLRGICDGVDTVLHIAARIGGDEDACRAVNVEGTRALLAEARRAGVRRIVQVGTAAVYGRGPHRGPAEAEVEPRPASPTSATRLESERLVLAAGGTVVRPYLVYGTGDTWVIPAVARLVRHFPHWVDEGRARVSLVAVDDLAAALVRLARETRQPPGGRVLHGSHPAPVRIRDLVTGVARCLGERPPADSLTPREAARRAAGLGPDAEQHVRMLSTDHWFSSTRLWESTGLPPGPGFATRFRWYAPWYAAALAEH